MAPLPSVALAPAKVNLSLRITGRRDDGYHLLDSLVAFTDFGDTVAVDPADDFSLHVDGPFAHVVPIDDDNLVLKAARALAQSYDVEDGATLTLTKNLPAAGGIGGGSADAAAVLRLLGALWGIDTNQSDVAGIALSLGADVPVCLHSMASRMSGIGEILQQTPALPEVGILLVNPGRACPTPAVFKAFDGRFSPSAPPLPQSLDRDTLFAYLAAEPNDLTAAAIDVCPAVGETLAILTDLPGCRLARMSGSGATCFALFDTPDAAYLPPSISLPESWWCAEGGRLF